MDTNSESNKIPKIIHYCWFGGKPIPEDLQECIDSWQKLKGYKIMRWDESNCSFDENEFVRKAYAEKKLAHISDYYRTKALYEHGGIYLDTDVMVFKEFDDLLSYEAFVNFIFDCAIGTAIIGAKKGNVLIKAMLDIYDSAILRNKSDKRELTMEGNTYVMNGFPTNNYILTYYVLNNYPDFRLNNHFQDMGDFVIYPKELFEIGTFTQKQYALHLCAGVWRADSENAKGIKGKIKSFIAKYPSLYYRLQAIIRKRRYNRLLKINPFYPQYLAQKKNKQMPKM